MFKNLSSEALGISGRQSEMIELGLSFGFRGIDLDILEFAEQVKARGIAHARRLIDSAKLKLGGFRLPVRWQATDELFESDLASFAEWAAPAAEVGCLRATTLVEPACNERPYHQNFEFHRQRITKVAARLAEYGLRLAIGFQAPGDLRRNKAFEFVHGLDALVLLLGTVRERNVGVLLDLWDLHLSGGTIEAVRKLGQQIVAVRVADAPAGTLPADCTSEDRLLPGETGVVPAAAALVVLAEVGYDGPVTPAPSPSRQRGLAREAVVRQTGAALDQLWKSAGLSPAGKLATAAKP